eukprot:TRINITY_DN2260_c0_g6_i1.p1 TRINITY_DN2260_c0_g6~~TRINITY_DN2260_c0_g6_i1.p1  ORF type:complete len:486 (+),score=65.06 TRINITY_DN2260_c0_g6_i1:79-1536(+)
MVVSVLIFLAALCLTVAESVIEELAALPWEDAASESDCIWVVEFFHPECGGCRALAGPFKETSQRIRKDELGCRIGSINCKTHPDTCRKYGVLDYPTLRVWGVDRSQSQPNIPVPDLDAAFADPSQPPPKEQLYNSIRNVCSDYNSVDTLKKCRTEISGKREMESKVSIIPDPIKKNNASDRVWVRDLRRALFIALTSEKLTHANATTGKTNLDTLVDLHKLATVAFPDRETRDQLRKHKFLAVEEKIESRRQPYDAEWVGCLGSKEQFRGLPCGLWQLFHSLSIGCHVSPLCKATEFSPLQIIKSWILNYYNCIICRNHFSAGTVGWKPEYLSSSEGVILLWKFHNEVNKRLAGDSTEDPHHPKIQFPSKQFCSYCYIGGHVDNLKLIQFLKKFYLATADVFEELPDPAGPVVVSEIGKFPQLPPRTSELPQGTELSPWTMFLVVLLIIAAYYSRAILVRVRRFKIRLTKRKGAYTDDGNLSMV